MFLTVAKSSSSFAEHSPNEAVDGVLDMHTCWWSETRQNSWWSVDLQRETTIRKIRIYNSVRRMCILYPEAMEALCKYIVYYCIPYCEIAIKCKSL